MKRLAIALAVAVLILSAAGTAAEVLSATKHERIDNLRRLYETYDQGHIFVVAHRGCWTAAPENSVASVEACIRGGVEVVEIDVQMTEDNELIVFHDVTLDRMTPGWGFVADHTLAELRALNLYERNGMPAGSGGRKLITQHRIATLAEVFELARGQIMINLEIKANHAGDFENTFQASKKLAAQMGVENHVLWKFPPALRGQAALDPSADAVYQEYADTDLVYPMPIIWEAGRGFRQQLADFEGTGVRGFEVVMQDLARWPLADDGRLVGADRYRYMGIAVLPRWSAGLSDELAMRDPEAAWGKMISLGIDMIMTDRPEQLLDYLRTRGLR